MIVTHDLSKHYREVATLEGLNPEITSREVVARIEDSIKF
jgi:hypothetical protein